MALSDDEHQEATLFQSHGSQFEYVGPVWYFASDVVEIKVLDKL